MWQMLKLFSVVVFLLSAVLVLYGLVKVGRASEASTPKPGIESGAPGVEITKVEPAGAADAQSQAMTVLAGSGLALALSVIVFGYATVKGRHRPAAG